MSTSTVNRLASRWQRSSNVALTGAREVMIADNILISALYKAIYSPSGGPMSTNAFYIPFLN